MSLIGSLDAATSGMNAQSVALGNISDNVSNSETVGYKGTNTAFQDFVTQSSTVAHSPDAVVATPEYTNSVQGTVTQVSDPTAMAISGNGFFAVQQPTSGSTFSAQQYYTRTGDFAPNSNGYLVNSTGFVLDGWPVTNGVANTNSLQPIQISTAPSSPVATANVNVAANLPSSPPSGTTSYTSTEQIYDAEGNTQNLTLTWSQVPTTAGSPISATNPAVANQWDLTVAGTGASSAATGPMLVTFGSTPTTAGTITSIAAGASDPAGTVPTDQTSGSAATIAVALNFGSGTQNLNLNLGSFGSPSGVTQFSGSDYAVSSMTQDGSAQSAYSSVTIQPSGDVDINYANGTTKTIAQVPLANFNNPDGLQQQNGQAFTSTEESGSAAVAAVGTGGSGTLTVGAVEGSNVDLSTQFTQMIVAQQAYTANTKIIATVNTLLQDVLNMVQG